MGVSPQGGHTIDASGKATLDGVESTFRDATELVEALAHSQQAHECFARQWLRYAIDRFEVDADEASLQPLLKSDRDVRSLLVDITRTLAFTHREPAQGEELEP